MVWTQAATEAIVAAAICLTLIIVRCGYRQLSNCKIHTSCHRTWHADDAWMAFSVLPLAARSVTIALSFSFAEPGRSHHDFVASRKLLIPSRLMYAFFLWCMKFCLVSFYSRFENGSAGIHRGIKILWYWIVITFLACVTATLAECVPMSIFWETKEPPGQMSCYEGKANLLTVATLNLVTDLTLILFPVPILWRATQLNFWVKVQLTLLFGVGIIVVAVTITRIPLILNHNFSQNVRTLWASVEIVSACVVANAAFYYALIKDIQSSHNTIPRRQSSTTANSLHWIQGDDSRSSASPIPAPTIERQISMNRASEVETDLP